MQRGTVPAPPAQRQQAAASAALATAPRVQALGDTARLLNARPALVTQRALARHLSARAPVQRKVRFRQQDDSITEPDFAMIIRWLENGGIQITEDLRDRVRAMQAYGGVLTVRWAYGQRRFMEMLERVFPAINPALVPEDRRPGGQNWVPRVNRPAPRADIPDEDDNQADSGAMAHGPAAASSSAAPRGLESIAPAFLGWLNHWAPKGQHDQNAQANLRQNWQAAAADLDARLRAVGIDPRPGNRDALAANLRRYPTQNRLWLSDMLTVLHDLRVFGPRQDFRPVQTIETVAKWYTLFSRQK